MSGINKYVRTIENSLEKAGFMATGWSYTSKGHLAFELEDGSTHFISKTPGDHRVVKNFVSQVRRRVAARAEDVTLH
ncbi:hypothetical protein PU634_10440 [Oceanimonas pelagia]|uniref:Uncharacterized protein n=1 Tax=Oceanimonas pelagia TaxID=3028314 RepID=A0AA50QAX0_9GAMM|nr:hypothetical protein [Oceanimonas pelagia]WMC09534.1 hypothetical protein PU634_10440 [Oceanimonas pelagia]